jgi:hypothetical protein
MCGTAGGTVDNDRDAPDLGSRPLIETPCRYLHEPSGRRGRGQRRRLAERGNNVAHILRDGRIEANTTTEERLLALTLQTDTDFLAPRSERIAATYRNQALRITRAAVARNRGRRS